jgi:succinyl-CoA synthetase beta subunit
MDLLEYQAKKLFRQIGIPVLPSETIAEPRELKQLQIPYPVVLKSQVKVGGRGKAGGVKFVTNTIDAIAAARTIFKLSILGEYPEIILAEARYNAEKELFLGIVLDYQLQRPVLFGSIYGGMDIERLIKNLQQVVIETEFSPFLARRLSSQMGLSGKLLLTVSAIIEKMYKLFCTKDLELIEINPLGVDVEGNLMALDGKISVNNDALAKHPEFVDLNPLKSETVRQAFQISSFPAFSTTEPKLEVALATKSPVHWLDWQDKKGKIAILANDDDLALLCWDLIRQKKEKPACAIVLDDSSWQEPLFKEQLLQVLEKLLPVKEIKLLLIDFWGTESVNLAIAKAIFELFEVPSQETASTIAEERAIIPINDSIERSRRSPTKLKLEEKMTESESFKIVIRLAVSNIEYYQQEFGHDAIFWTNNLEDAINQAISFSKTK